MVGRISCTGAVFQMIQFQQGIAKVLEVLHQVLLPRYVYLLSSLHVTTPSFLCICNSESNQILEAAKAVCAHEINFHEINSHVVKSKSTAEINFNTSQLLQNQLNS